MTSGGKERFAAETNVSRETLDLLQKYADLLERWNTKINLVSPATLSDVWIRHFLDSAQLLESIDPRGKWVDLGSGAGFPGLIVAILLRDRADMSMTLVEADQRKATFLRTVVRELGLTVDVQAKRIEALAPFHANILSARALAPLSVLIGYADTHLKPGGLAIFPKGEKAEEEIADALETWQFDCEKRVSRTDANSALLCIGDIKRV